ncbi:patatin-like phospholipase family protein [Rhizobiales bacterium]|uniref:patatin-like phospholipase family protein n=1 Tax=Hongsoonwoonella zoysiae TaxID=2821844 RepID=UPI001560445D|nr:patatin-like phospholipase family protein [Hongsoonwoonella zoysiae]NRG19823.1 patatin-like phospholipase family protein [Hongsoonwoonella zoysiae]
MASPRIGLALGGGGARGLAHVPVLEAFDDLGITPHAIAGTSIGALIGAGYAGGMSGDQIRAYIEMALSDRNAVLARLWQLRPKRFADIFSGGGGGVMQFDPLRVLEVFAGDAIPKTFEELKIPLTVLATDFYGCREVDLRSGPLHSAVAASIAIPALFKPVTIQDRIMIDGGVVNPLPFDALPQACDIVVAVDVVGSPVPRRKTPHPSASDSLFGATQILMQSVVSEKLKSRRPDILVRPDIEAFRVLDFLKARKIMDAAQPTRETVKREIEKSIRAIEKSGNGEKIA